MSKSNVFRLGENDGEITMIGNVVGVLPIQRQDENIAKEDGSYEVPLTQQPLIRFVSPIELSFLRAGNHIISEDKTYIDEMTEAFSVDEAKSLIKEIELACEYITNKFVDPPSKK